MSHSAAYSLWAVSAALGAVLLGCSAEPEAGPAATTAAPPAKSSTAGSSRGQVSEEEAGVKESVAKLSPEDRALAEAQETCPVTGELLGSMGAPIKVAVEGRDVFVCYEGCVDEPPAATSWQC